MLVRTVAGMLLALCLSAGQDSTSLSGQVSEHGTPVAGAIVTISNRGFIKSVTADAGGRFAFEAVPPGRYDFRTSAHGYAVFERTVILHSDNAHRNWIDVKDLIPADQQSVSVTDLATRKLARN
ncbi:MAG TPA: carboxypeptidase-like regulatory domain-containing protein [Bryobacteraceae bacterium]|nr:carboxypeptidase-like regulatory domain-containing protein [Bryobacteraceae bacterium]